MLIHVKTGVSLKYFVTDRRFPVELICCIAFGSAVNACCLFEFIAIIL